MNEGVPEAQDEDDEAIPTGAAQILAGIVTVVVLGGILIGALTWWSARDTEPVPCAEDATHLVDREAGLCLTIPQDWVKVEDTEFAEDADFSMFAEADSGNAWVRTGPVPDEIAGSDAEDAAREIIALLTGVSPDASVVQVENETVEGRERATIEQDSDIFWYQVTVVDLDGRLAMAVGSTFGGEDGLIEEVNQIHESLSIA
jgi:uncharacterized iron-regulated membrane protein